MTDLLSMSFSYPIKFKQYEIQKMKNFPEKQT